MELTIAKKELSRALAGVVGIMSQKPTIPALAHVLLEATGNQLTIQGTDLELGVSYTLEQAVTRPGKVLVPGKKLFDIVREFPEADLTLKSEREKRLQLSQGRSRLQLNGLPSGEFAHPSPLKDARAFKVGAATMRAGIAGTRAVVTVSDNAPHLSGILVTTEDGWLTLVTTDTRRLARYRSKVNLNEEIRFIMPLKTADTLRGLWEAERELTVEQARSQAVFSGGGITLSTQLIEGNFPDYTRVIPDENNLLGLEVPREQFMAALRRIRQVVVQGRRIIRLEIKPNLLVVSGETAEVGAGSEEIEIAAAGATETVFFDPDYLLDGLRQLDEEEMVFMGINPDPDKPNVIRNIKNRQLLYLVMPMRGEATVT